MSGYGSGKETTSEYLRLDIRTLQRKGYLVPGRSTSLLWTRNGERVGAIDIRAELDRVVLSYNHHRNEGAWQHEEYPVFFDWTPCNYGGQRPWFVCPARGCRCRVGMLYGGGIFACRHCYQLAYESQRETASDRALTRMQNIRMRLGGSANTLEPFPTKPKGMHWGTYERLRSEADRMFSRSIPDWLLRQIASSP